MIAPTASLVPPCLDLVGHRERGVVQMGEILAEQSRVDDKKVSVAEINLEQVAKCRTGGNDKFRLAHFSISQGITARSPNRPTDAVATPRSAGCSRCFCSQPLPAFAALVSRRISIAAAASPGSVSTILSMTGWADRVSPSRQAAKAAVKRSFGVSPSRPVSTDGRTSRRLMAPASLTARLRTFASEWFARSGRRGPGSTRWCQSADRPRQHCSASRLSSHFATSGRRFSRGVRAIAAERLDKPCSPSVAALLRATSIRSASPNAMPVRQSRKAHPVRHSP